MMKRIPIPSMITAIVIILILVIYSITYQVRFSEAVVKVRFGKPRAVIDEPGLELKWPAPIETVRHYDTRLRVLDTPETEKTTVTISTISNKAISTSIAPRRLRRVVRDWAGGVIMEWLSLLWRGTSRTVRLIL